MRSCLHGCFRTNYDTASSRVIRFLYPAVAVNCSSRGEIRGFYDPDQVIDLYIRVIDISTNSVYRVT